MILKTTIPVTLFCAIVWSFGMESDVVAWAQVQTAGTEIERSGEQEEWEDAAQLFVSAYQSYNKAKTSDSLGIQSEAYAEAIRDISKACQMEPANVEYLMLASQIYRSKGGSSYAKDYFSRGERILQNRLEQESYSVSANLDYAIACLAGEGHFSKEFRKKGEKSLDRVIKLCEGELKSETRHGDIILALGMAYLLKGQHDKGEKALAKAADLDSTSEFYHSLYESTVKNGTWIWKVGKDGAVREFCMYYLLDMSRNYRE